MKQRRARLGRFLAPDDGPGHNCGLVRRFGPALGVVLGLAVIAACSPKQEHEPDVRHDAKTEPAPPVADCPLDPIHVEAAPGVEKRHRDPAFWLDRLGSAADEVLLDPAGVQRVNARTREVDGAWRDVLSDEIGDRTRIAKELSDRSAWMRKRLEAAKYVEGEPGAFEAANAIIENASDIDELRVVTAETQTFCVPTEAGIYSVDTRANGETSHDPDFDRNHCSSLHPGELVRALRRSEDAQWWHVHAGHSVGWLHAPAWTPALPPKKAAAFRDATPRLLATRDDVPVGPTRLRLGVSLPILQEGSEGWKVQVPTPKGLESASVKKSPALRQDPPPLSRRALFELALSQLDAPYGWGGRAGGRDCSRFLFDDFAQFGIELARHSSVQAQLGSESIELAGLDEAAKRQRIHEAAARGVVLLYMSGHIMLYLGEDEGHDYAVSSLSEYLVPCPGGPDTVYRLDRVAVTTLEVGRGSERTSFIERIERIAVFGPPAAPAP